MDGFKSLCKNKHWPFVLILSGVPALAGFVNGYDQLRELLKPVHFGLIQYPKDIAEVNNLCFAYADHGDIEFDPLAKRDFYERLAFANGYRWGLVIEMLIEALTLCKLDGRTEIDTPARFNATRSPGIARPVSAESVRMVTNRR